MSTFFPYEFDKRFLPMWACFGGRPSRDGVTLTDDARFEATFGFFKVSTSLDNIDDAHITRGYRWWTAVGVRGSMADDGLTFGTNTHGGVCVHFREKVHRVIGLHDHSALTVTVADLEGLQKALAAT